MLSYARPGAVTDFKPPKPSRAFIRGMQLINLVYGLRRAKLECDARDLETLRRLPAGAIIAPNHSDYADAIVVTELGRRPTATSTLWPRARPSMPGTGFMES